MIFQEYSVLLLLYVLVEFPSFLLLSLSILLPFSTLSSFLISSSIPYTFLNLPISFLQLLYPKSLLGGWVDCILERWSHHHIFHHASSSYKETGKLMLWDFQVWAIRAEWLLSDFLRVLVLVWHHAFMWGNPSHVEKPCVGPHTHKGWRSGGPTPFQVPSRSPDTLGQKQATLLIPI